MKSHPLYKMADQIEARRVKRDAEVLRLAREGRSNAEIGRRLGVSRQRVQQIRARLGHAR